ncbi:MAG: FxLYD domain-containing protein [Alphaproteobacteria bacterium]
MTEVTNEKSQITLGLITSWGLGGLFLLAGITGMFQPDAAGMGVASLLIALLLLPPIRRFAHKTTGMSVSTGVRMVLFFVLLMGGAASMPQTEFAVNTFEVSQADSPAAATTTATAKKEAPPKGLFVEEFSLQMDAYGVGKIVGTLKNTTGREYGYIQIEFNLYDAGGNQVGSTLANINNLEPGRTWKFEAPVLTGEATEAQVKNITSF